LPLLVPWLRLRPALLTRAATVIGGRAGGGIGLGRFLRLLLRRRRLLLAARFFTLGLGLFLGLFLLLLSLRTAVLVRLGLLGLHLVLGLRLVLGARPLLRLLLGPGSLGPGLGLRGGVLASCRRSAVLGHLRVAGTARIVLILASSLVALFG